MYKQVLGQFGWVYRGQCGCAGNMEEYSNALYKTQKIQIGRNGYFYHWDERYCIKSDYIENLKRHLESQQNGKI
jgi:hypothetical protein